MKKLILSSMFALAMLGGCHQKQLAQQKAEANKAREMAEKQALKAERSALLAKLAEQKAQKQLQIAERARQEAILAAKTAEMLQKQCEAQNRVLLEKVAKLEKKK
ncbi:hypothetical protein [uncultured Microscilla sp.]|uniref:hypothetical protein n=1 Tax=uncultured Microscilla sp. TaxID=432653 RepID=UPI002627AE41|nr:hypothetical protein [uncultured Microscilla sp.]